MKHLEAAMNDSEYVKYTSQVFETMENEMDRLRRTGINEPDAEIDEHYEQLDRYQLRSTDWKTEPIDIPSFSYVNPLLHRMLRDLDKR